jgi:hypothetical protein
MVNVSKYQTGDRVTFGIYGMYFGEVFEDLGPEYAAFGKILPGFVYVRDYTCAGCGHLLKDESGRAFKGWCIAEKTLWDEPDHGFAKDLKRDPEPEPAVAAQVLSVKPQQHVIGLDPEQIDWERHRAWLGEYR